ncbi:glycoside hydrolase family 15 protein [uncultured Metabacillus sp.]|uniref:glycoside hydrolase family 15 protein n=1 Tax=Metabacillus sp. Hm71 TaxID=3450743 RepID=UPI0026316AB3|nr:glycoside hydrolase family 15 protein [uncultured Metabacillus sp.]
MNKLNRQYEIIKSLETENGAFYASASSDYSKVWLRDSMYIALAYIDKTCNTFERAIQAHLDYFRQYEWKLDIHLKQKPHAWFEFMHIRYSAHDMKEIEDQEWAHVQLDAYSSFLWAIGMGVKKGKKMLRDEKDKEIIQKLVWYLNTLEYWRLEESGAWEEQRELRLSSLGACVAALEIISDIVFVPAELIARGFEALYSLFPNETPTRKVDLFQLTLIYPYNILPRPMAQLIIHNVEKELLKDKAVLRYCGDSYFSTLEKEHGRNHPKEFFYGSEAQWVFGLSFLALSHMTMGNLEKGKYYIERTEKLILDDGNIPELYFAGDYRDEYGNNYNENNPLCWSVSMHIQAVEMYEKLNKKQLT